MSEKIKNIAKNSLIEYIKWRGDLSFDQDKFNEIDSFILTQLTYYDYNGLVFDEPIKLKTVLQNFYNQQTNRKIKLGLIVPNHIADLGKLVMKSKRFEDIYISNYVDKYDKIRKEQFCAVTFHINDKFKVISFKGTDDTLIGWEEDFNMIVSFPISAQISALDYFVMVYNKYPNAQFDLCGHSKGGNLAMYAGLYASDIVKYHIHKIYNFDGPGFETDDIDLVLYSQIKNKIKTILPTNSIIGMIFNQLGTVKVVKSSAKPIFQHDGFTWEIDVNKFSKSSLSTNSINFSESLNAFVAKLDENTRKSLCDSLEKCIDKLNIKTLSEITTLKPKSLSALNAFTKNDRIIFLEFIKIVIKSRIFM